MNRALKARNDPVALAFLYTVTIAKRLFRAFSARMLCEPTWGAAPGYHSSRRWRCIESIPLRASFIKVNVRRPDGPQNSYGAGSRIFLPLGSGSRFRLHRSLRFL